MRNTTNFFYKICFFALLFSATAIAQTQTITGSTRLEPLNPISTTSIVNPTLSSLKPVASPPALVPQQATYLHPGILVFRNNTWEGGDHLLNVSSNIGVYVSIIKPESDPLAISEESLKNIVNQIFKKFNINPVTLAAPGHPPLPAFQIQILAYPIDKGYVVTCEGRLFESVSLQRFVLDPAMAFQAITWEKKGLHVGPTDKIIEQIQTNVAEIAQSFGERFDAFERRKKDLSR
ncbi:hypothetical protein [Candidatus Protochlamydia sp. R18]|uniref:hypothetical protein n=1 Tax=Candidatus Protochlamydia sp. R18 TaxID=1353977 RepID=UPI0006938BCB|nr:hypothetical protein [Candidatus Protochlamydia sp. R18]